MISHCCRRLRWAKNRWKIRRINWESLRTTQKVSLTWNHLLSSYKLILLIVVVHVSPTIVSHCIACTTFALIHLINSKSHLNEQLRDAQRNFSNWIVSLFSPLGPHDDWEKSLETLFLFYNSKLCCFCAIRLTLSRASSPAGLPLWQQTPSREIKIHFDTSLSNIIISFYMYDNLHNIIYEPWSYNWNRPWLTGESTRQWSTLIMTENEWDARDTSHHSSGERR